MQFICQEMYLWDEKISAWAWKNIFINLYRELEIQACPTKNGRLALTILQNSAQFSFQPGGQIIINYYISLCCIEKTIEPNLAGGNILLFIAPAIVQEMKHDVQFFK
jgi:hypothetical protein